MQKGFAVRQNLFCLYGVLKKFEANGLGIAEVQEIEFRQPRLTEAKYFNVDDLHLAKFIKSSPICS